ncbi:MAG: deoxyhypusine synthase family protein, partial [archaeon]|nr:deoxyhypusine synthase family protein [archaeon]
SFLYWCSKNNIPVYCPGITDGAAFGLQMYFFKQENSEFGIDVTADLKPLLDSALNAEKTGAIILGGGISKHHIIGANIIRDGLDYAVYVSTAQEFDGSLSGAKPKEAKSWGKLKEKAEASHVNCDATIALPIIYRALMERGLL